MRGEKEGDVALVLRGRITRLRIAMTVGDRLVDRLVEKRREVIRRTPGLARARQQLGFHLATGGQDRAAGHPRLA